MKTVKQVGLDHQGEKQWSPKSSDILAEVHRFLRMYKNMFISRPKIFLYATQTVIILVPLSLWFSPENT